MKTVMVFGSPKAACVNCRKAEAMVEEIVNQYHDQFELKKLTLDSNEAQTMGIMMTPCVVMDNTILIMGEIPTMQDLKKAMLGE